MTGNNNLVAGYTTGPKYWRSVETDEALRTQLDLIPPEASVLEIGPAAGHMTEALLKKGCEVIAIEVDPDSAALAARFCKKIIVANIEQLDLYREFRDERFDVILLGDVLEHLQAPGSVLRALKSHLAPGGSLVVSIPNVAHASVRLALLQGKFDYQRDGLLDSTHLRFFTLYTMIALFHNPGYEIRDLKRIRKGFFDTSISVDPSTVPVSVLRRLCRDPEAESYQFVFRAVPSEGSVHEPMLADEVQVADTNWTPGEARSKVAMEYMKEGRATFWKDPPNVHRTRRLYYRAFALYPHLKPLAVFFDFTASLPGR